MKILATLFAGLLPLTWVVTGCQTSHVMHPVAVGDRAATRDNCYTLLHQLLSDQKNVGLLRFIKREENDVKELIKRIAANSAAGAKLLEELAEHNPAIRMDNPGLPQGETATREAIAATKQKELLAQTGEVFELSLLLTQAEALSYGWHLAYVASANEIQPDRARALAGIGDDMKKLYSEVFTKLRSRRK